MEIDQIPVRDPQVIWRVLEDELVLVRATSGEIRVLNRVGAFLWQILDTDLTMGELARQVSQTYQVSESQAQADVSEFLDELESETWISTRRASESC